jgi:hypothetical protein
VARSTVRARMPAKAKLALAAMLFFLPAVWLVDRHDRMQLQHRLEPIASDIARRPVQVHCPGWWGRLLSPGDTNAGVVALDEYGGPADHTDLRAATCAELDALVEGRRKAELACAARSSSCGDDVQALAWAVGTLAHESFHLRGILDEGLTECYAIQTMASTAQRLGATPVEAQNLAILHWETGVPQMPASYQEPGCENGGAHDLRRDDPVWP